ncbi:MAG TPA: alanine racemase C-terminal domain-containing protein, partial [Negativicutes bacterium]|nr:alanine racemase C-terminal domain-containing protein [Negativicutes bacterium]
EISVDEIAGILNTINYEVVCWVGDRVPRVYINRE